MSTLPLRNDFNGGTPGANVLTTDQGSGDPWDSISVTTAPFTYDNSIVHEGACCGMIVEPATGVTARCGWTGLGAIVTDVWVRMYIYATANPAADWKISNVRTSTGAAASAQISIDTNGKIHVIGPSATLNIDSVNSITLSQQVRIEYRILASATAGQFEWWLYNNPEAPIGSHTETKVATGQVLGADTGELRFGVASTSAPTSQTLRIDSVEASATGPLGPLVPRYPGGRPTFGNFPKYPLSRVS